MIMTNDSGTTNCDDWMADTGAGVHVCTDEADFSSMEKDTLTFVGWKGDVSSSEASGLVNISATDAVAGCDVTLGLEDTRYTSKGTTNLLSLE
ncbi:hypothetical protein PI126_g17734 [Phytophthora idaei]|nr:hypothetical protein PI126_g17734 [Phytophthora idaei]